MNPSAEPIESNQADEQQPAVFKGRAEVTGGRPWAALVEQLDAAEACLEHDDPYVRAAAYASRASVYGALHVQTRSPVYAAACARASVLDEQTAARIRFEHDIPTLYPGTSAEAVGLRRCQHCGRPWQDNAAGACEHCPRLLFGPTPRTRAEAGKFPPGEVVNRSADLVDVAPAADR